MYISIIAILKFNYFLISFKKIFYISENRLLSYPSFIHLSLQISANVYLVFGSLHIIDLRKIFNPSEILDF
jgi:hypothetical protein